MPKKKIINEYYIKVVIREYEIPHWCQNIDGTEEQKSICEDVIKDIKRHVDNVDYCEVVEDFKYECSHCGYAWTEDDSEYNGGCCAADEDNKPEALGV